MKAIKSPSGMKAAFGENPKAVYGSKDKVATRKAYGEAHSLKGSALKKAHEKYRLTRGTNANQNIASLLAGGKIVAEKSRVSFDKVTGEPVRMNVVPSRTIHSLVRGSR